MAKQSRRLRAKSKRRVSTLVGRKVELRDLRLVESTTALALDKINLSALPKELTQQTNVTLLRSDKEPKVIFIVTFILKTTTENGIDLVAFQASFAIAYAFDSLDGVEDAHLHEFGQTTGLLCVWPYWREFVQSMSGRMGLPPLTIPLMKAGELKFSRAKPSDMANVKPTKAGSVK